jgi:hypothetical protein
VWESIGASEYILKIIDGGFTLPFISQPTRRIFDNHESILEHTDFVKGAIQELLLAGSISKVNSKSDLLLCSPIKVAVRATTGKLRLIVNLRSLNEHIDCPHFRIEDLRIAREWFAEHDHVIAFDIKSAYHHVTIHPRHRPWLGIQFQGVFYQFSALPFGLNISPWLFTKVMKCPIDHWRKIHGFRVGCFIDDGYATADSATAATAMSRKIRSDLQDLGFLYYDSPPKSF